MDLLIPQLQHYMNINFLGYVYHLVFLIYTSTIDLSDHSKSTSSIEVMHSLLLF
jgi:hypothetical protein